MAFRFNIRDYEIVGSYKRGNPICNDIDLLINSRTNDIEALHRKMIKSGFRYNKVRNGSNNMASDQYLIKICGKIIILDFFYYDAENYGTLQLFATGPKSHSDKIRAKLKKMGYSWSNPSYFKHIETGNVIKFASEIEAFNFLKMHYKEPKDRQ
jgi:DNA polymerase/3'-5' exonuclease PolX